MTEEQIIHPREDLSHDTTASLQPNSYAGEDEVPTPEPAVDPYAGNEGHSVGVFEHPTQTQDQDAQGREDTRIEDNEKARVMAQAGNALRIEAAKDRHAGYSDGSRWDEKAKKAEEKAGNWHDSITSLESRSQRIVEPEEAGLQNENGKNDTATEQATQIMEPVTETGEPAQPEDATAEPETASSDQELVSYWRSVLSKNPISDEYLQYVHVDPNILEDEGAELDESGKLAGVSAESLARLEAREKIFIKEAGEALELAHGYDDDQKLPELMAEIMNMKDAGSESEGPESAQAEKLLKLLRNRITTMDDLRQCWHNFHSNIAKEKLGVALTIGGFLDDVRDGHASKTGIRP